MLLNNVVQHCSGRVSGSKVQTTHMAKKRPIALHVLNLPVAKRSHPKLPPFHHVPAESQKLVSLVVNYRGDVQVQGFNHEGGFGVPKSLRKQLIWKKDRGEPEESCCDILIEHSDGDHRLLPVAAFEDRLELSPRMENCCIAWLCMACASRLYPIGLRRHCVCSTHGKRARS